MGAGELRSSFNSVSQPAFTCTMALLDYKRGGGAEWQILLFRGTAADGSPFEIKSEGIRAGVDVNQAAKETAQRLLDQGKAPP